MSTAPPCRRVGLAFPAHPDNKSLAPATRTTDTLTAAAAPGRATMDEPASHALYPPSPRPPEGSAWR
jgi:hypothetical protein